MFKVAKIKEIKVKQNPKKIIKSLKKTNLFISTISSPIKIEEKPISTSNSVLFTSSNSLESGKSQTNFDFEINDKTSIKPKKMKFLSKKIKFNIFKDNINKIKPKEKKLIKIKKMKKMKILPKEGINEGRWGENEHLRFLDAIYNYGTQWRQVQRYVSTRSSRQVRSHAQKFYLKLKVFKDPELGFDFTPDRINNLTEIINIIKDFEKNNNCDNILSLLNKKLSEPNFKNNNNSHDNILNENNEEDVLVKYNSIIINNQAINEDNDNDIMVKKHNIKNKKRKIFKTIICKRINKNKLKEINNMPENREDNYTEKDKNENKEIIENKNIYDENDFKNNNIYLIDDYMNDSSNQFECETNDKYFPSFSNIIKEAITNSLMNRDYFC